MPIITLPDGNNLSFPDKVTGLDVAEKISKSLAKQAMVISIAVSYTHLTLPTTPYV